MYSLRGLPRVPEGESELSRWMMLNVKPAGSASGVWRDDEQPGSGEFFEGELKIILTDKAVRGTSNEGTVHKYGKLDGAWVGFAFVLPLNTVDWIVAGKRAVAFGSDQPVAVVAAKAYHRADAAWDYKVGPRSDNSIFATNLTMAVARAQSDHFDAAWRQCAREVMGSRTDVLPINRRGRPPEFRFDK